MNISIVVVNYNVKDFLLRCLESIYSSNIDQIEVILVDNASNDGSIEAVSTIYPQTIILKNLNNIGFPAANNQAFKIARGKYIFMLNPDAELFKNTLETLFSFMEENPNVDIIAPQILNTDGSWQQSVWRFLTLYSIFCEMLYMKFLLNKKDYNDQNKNELFEADSFSGAAIFFNREVLNKIGMLDETMFWIEDIDFCYRAKKTGLKLIYYPYCKVMHHIGQSARKDYKISISNQIFNKIKFFRKHYNPISYFSVIFISYFHVILKFLIFGLLSIFKKEYRKKAVAYFYTLGKIYNPPKGIK